MTVTSIWVENQIFTNDAILQKKGLVSKFTQEILAEAIGFNTLPFPKKSSETGKMIKNGNKTDCALIEFIDSWGFGLANYRPSDRILKVVPFSSSRKKMTTIVSNQS
jgi:Ca2+ transporting ATPase